MMSFKYLLLISNQRKKIPKARKKPGKIVALQNNHGFGHHAFKRMQRTPVKLKASYACKDFHHIPWHIELSPPQKKNTKKTTKLP